MALRKPQRKPAGERKAASPRKPRRQANPQSVFRRFVRLLEKLEAGAAAVQAQEPRR